MAEALEQTHTSKVEIIYIGLFQNIERTPQLTRVYALNKHGNKSTVNNREPQSKGIITKQTETHVYKTKENAFSGSLIQTRHTQELASHQAQ